MNKVQSRGKAGIESIKGCKRRINLVTMLVPSPLFDSYLSFSFFCPFGNREIIIVYENVSFRQLKGASPRVFFLAFTYSNPHCFVIILLLRHIKHAQFLNILARVDDLKRIALFKISALFALVMFAC